MVVSYKKTKSYRKYLRFPYRKYSVQSLENEKKVGREISVCLRRLLHYYCTDVPTENIN